MTATQYLPENTSLSLLTLCHEIEKGSVKIPQFQRDFVWTKKKSAELLDSVLKGYPIGTFILWKTREELRAIRNIGRLELPPTPKGDFALYVLDGQQRMTSLFAAVKGLTITRGDEETEDFSLFYVDLEAEGDAALVHCETDPDSHEFRWITLHDLLYGKISQIAKYPESAQDVIQQYKDRLNSYQFPVVSLREAPIDVATDVFTRLNVSGKDLSMFEIMVAKTYDAQRQFDLAERYESLSRTLDDVQYGTLPASAVMQAVAACIQKDTRKKSILSIPKSRFIDEWESVKNAIGMAVDYLRSSIGVPVSQLLPYAAMIVPFTYYFYKAQTNPNAIQGSLLQEFFWRVGLGERYGGQSDTRIAQDIRRMDNILKGKPPAYDWNIDLSYEYLRDNGTFQTGRAYIKTLLCLLASRRPLSLRDGHQVNIQNDWLSRSNSRNYHHFFPRSYLQSKGFEVREENHILNITLIDEQNNKKEIGAKPPSRYIRLLRKGYPEIDRALASHFILTGFGIDTDDYETFRRRRAEKFRRALQKKLRMDQPEQ